MEKKIPKVRVSFSLPKLLLEALEKQAEAEDRSVSNILARHLKNVVQLPDSYKEAAKK